MTKRTVNTPESVPHQPIVLNKAPEHRITLEAPCIDALGPDLPPIIVPPPGTIIPGNRYFRLEGKSYYFTRNMPLEAEGREGQLHRGICPITKWPDNWKGGSQAPVIYVCEA